jgi:glycosyltransferase involved in cell wall biosynthesis
MRILQVLPYFSPRMGGVAHVVYHVARYLGKKGHDVTVVAGDYKYREKSFPESDFRQVMLRSMVSQWGFYLTPSLVAWAREHVAGFDVIHMHEVRTFQNVIMRHFAVRYGIPYVLSAHGTLPIIVERKLAKRAYDLLFGRALLTSASRLVAVSPVEVEQYRQAGIEEERIRVIYNGLDLDEFSHLPPRGTFRRKLGIAERAKVVLFLGRLHKRKGINYLIEAFARLRTEVSNPVLIIAGPDDGELARLQALSGRLRLGERVRFTGPLYGEDKLAAYVDADVLASPAVYEIFGLVPFEALMCGTPVVVTDDCGSGQLIGEAQAGYLVSYGDVEGLAAALLQALSNREEAMRKVKAGQGYIRERLDWDVIVRDLESVYTEVVNR